MMKEEKDSIKFSQFKWWAKLLIVYGFVSLVWNLLLGISYLILFVSGNL
jgi:hypothetical protein